MPYTRWGITEAAAETLTGVSPLTEADLDAAEADIVDAIGWAPDPVAYDAETDVRARAFGRAVAWQAAYRSSTPASAEDGSGARVTSESITDYSVAYADGTGPVDRPLVAPRVSRLLKRGGWYRLAGRTAGSGVTRQAFDDWQRNRV